MTDTEKKELLDGTGTEILKEENGGQDQEPPEKDGEKAPEEKEADPEDPKKDDEPEEKEDETTPESPMDTINKMFRSKNMMRGY